MKKNVPFKKVAIYLLAAAAVFACSQGVFAHTRLESPTVLEGTRVHNYVVISHGCPPATARNPTMGTSVVFPNAVGFSPIIGVDSGGGKVYTTNSAASYYSPLAGIGALIRPVAAWTDYNQLKVDSAGNKDGFWAGGKAYDQTISSYIDIPFYSAAVTIAPKSCARSVTFELAIADFCSIAQPGSKAADAQVLYWSPIPNFTGVPGQPFGAPVADATRSIPAAHAFSNYDGYADAAHTIAGDGWGSPATLKVTRNLTTNPLPSGCTGNAGLGDDVYVYPSADQINHELPVWSNPDQTGTNVWQ